MSAFSPRNSLLLATAVVALLVSVSPLAHAYTLTYESGNFPPTGSYEWEHHWTYFGDLELPGTSGTLAAGLSVDIGTSIPEYHTDWDFVYHPPDPELPQWYFMAALLDSEAPGVEPFQFSALDDQDGTVVLPGLKAGNQDLYVAVNLGAYAASNPNPSFDFGQSLQVNNGSIAGFAGVNVSRSPISVDLNSPTGFSAASWYSGLVQVNARFTGTPVPEPSSLAALLSCIAGMGVWRRRK